MSNSPVLCCEQLVKSFQDGAQSVEVLNGIDLQVHAGQAIAISGASGSGKSTLLHLLGGLDRPTSGVVNIEGHALNNLSDHELASLRNRFLGFVYQFHHLLPEMNCIENVAMPLLIGGSPVDAAKESAENMLKKMGLSHRMLHRHAQLSGGERQRVALARALVTSPKCLLADEPTGNLDSRTASDVIDLMLALRSSSQTAIVIVTHDHSIASRMDSHYILTSEGLKISERE